ncbi:hypothetical protein [Methanosarcina horonobensis]|uniref:hypothetical protein n=1 Tax=Methanosarcina horonobensis TaxID=418008 RepID=UPI001EF6253C|nr:hypothetical protein [Methanosarcina horonobensis]
MINSERVTIPGKLSIFSRPFLSRSTEESDLSQKEENRKTKEKSQIEHAPHFNAPSKLLNKSEITPILHQLVLLSALPVAGLETDFAIDSTGFRITTFNVYTETKYGNEGT